MGIDILGIDIMGVDILGIDIPAPTLFDYTQILKSLTRVTRLLSLEYFFIHFIEFNKITMLIE